MKLGLEVFLEKEYLKYKDERVGLLTNPTGVNRNLQSTVDLLYEKLNLKALFAPEHGFRADVKEGGAVEDTVDSITGLPIYSLYGKSKKPTEQQLKDIDVFIIDIQDIGARYYTFIYTMALIMEACKEQNKRVVIFDRPNPIGGKEVEGNLVNERFKSFVGMYPIPMRHGMTIGELALLFNERFKIHANLTVIKMEGWKREQYFDELPIPWVPPSPNVTGLSMQLLYPGTCLIEGTNLSEGRGTVRPFEVIGAPYVNSTELANRFNELNLNGVIARPTSFKPTYSKYMNEICHGVQLHIVDQKQIKPVEVGIRLLETIIQLYPNDLEFITYENLEHPFFDLLAGTDQLRHCLYEKNGEKFINQMRKEEEKFLNIRDSFLIYN